MDMGFSLLVVGDIRFILSVNEAVTYNWGQIQQD